MRITARTTVSNALVTGVSSQLHTIWKNIAKVVLSFAAALNELSHTFSSCEHYKILLTRLTSVVCNRNEFSTYDKAIHTAYVLVL